jgi:hypothetical protein
MGQCLSMAEEETEPPAEKPQALPQQQLRQDAKRARRVLDDGDPRVYLDLVQGNPRASAIVRRASELPFTPNVLAQRSASARPLSPAELALAHQRSPQQHRGPADPPPPPPRSPLTFHYYTS